MLSQKDIKILCELRKNGRIQLKELSRKTRIPISTIFDRLQFFNSSFIQKHTTLVDFAALGYTTRASIFLLTEREERDKIKDFLARHPNVNTVLRINNGFDFMVEGLFKTVVDMENFLSLLDNKFKLKETKFYYVIEEVNKEQFLANSEIEYQ